MNSSEVSFSASDANGKYNDVGLGADVVDKLKVMVVDFEKMWGTERIS